MDAFIRQNPGEVTKQWLHDKKLSHLANGTQRHYLHTLSGSPSHRGQGAAGGDPDGSDVTSGSPPLLGDGRPDPYARISCLAASTILGASGRSQLIISAEPGPGTSGKAIFFVMVPGTSCTTSAMTCEPKPFVSCP